VEISRFAGKQMPQHNLGVIISRRAMVLSMSLGCLVEVKNLFHGQGQRAAKFRGATAQYHHRQPPKPPSFHSTNALQRQIDWVV
jgi:hypothetical protein